MTNKAINKKTLYIVDVILFIVGIVLDRVSKYFAVIKLKDHPSVSVINGIMELKYLENTGAAFGLLKNQKSFFVLVAVFVLIGSLYVMVKTPAKKKYVSCHIYLSFILCGAIGNLIDRVLYGYVVDFIYISIINFPIFNIADIFVTVSTVLIACLLLFKYKEDDLNFLRIVEKKIRDI